MYGCSFIELSELSYTIPKKVINRQLLNAIAFVARTPTSSDWNSRPFVVEFVNEIALMAPRNAEDDGLQLFIFSFAHKLWVKRIEYSSFVLLFCTI